MVEDPTRTAVNEATTFIINTVHPCIPMKTTPSPKTLGVLSILLAAMLVIGASAGCGKTGDPKPKASLPANHPPPVAEAILATWAQGDSAAAVRQFLETDWSARPLFAPGSAMNLSEAQFKALPTAEREAKAAEVQSHLATVRKLAGAVAEAGRAAAAKRDDAMARKHFAALEQLGGALDSPDSMVIVKLVGQALKKMATAETAKLPQ